MSASGESFRVSVIIPVYNEQRYVEQAVQSALMQPQTHEVLVVDDGSTDRSPEICRRISERDPRVRVLSHPNGCNRGRGASRNLGIVHAACDYVAFLDADDYYLPRRFRACSEAFAEDPDIDGVYHATELRFDSAAAKNIWKDIPVLRRKDRVITIKGTVGPEDLLGALVAGDYGFFSTDAITVKRSLFQRSGLFDESLTIYEDTALWLKMAVVGRLVPGSVEAPVAVYRVRESSTLLNARTGFDPDLKRMYETLDTWCRENGIRNEQAALLHYRQWLSALFGYDRGVRTRFYEIKLGRRGAGRYVRMLGFIAWRLIRRPSLIFRREFIRLIRTQSAKILRPVDGGST